MLSRLATPFVLLDDARTDGRARLYAEPVRIVAADTLDGVAAARSERRAARAGGLHAAGYLRYEAAAAFEPALGPPADPPRPLLWFGLFAEVTEFAANALPKLLPDPAGAWIAEPAPELDRAGYDAAFAAVQARIVAGTLYQANLTYRATARVAGDPLALYARLRDSARAGYGALIATGDAHILSLSPELFFALDRDTLTCRPMKGTAGRGETPDADRQVAEQLANDPKQLAENLMIVDLMRNDLARVAVAGSVRVPSLFAVERYPTVHQMVSEVTATLAPGRDAVDVLGALFPCGSVTGAPKIAAIQAIGEIEVSARGLYTGAIGCFDANGDARFNVAIRTLVWPRDADRVTLGAGGGIVADSDADGEWAEARAKTAFLTRAPAAFDLIETMAFDPEHGLMRLERHIARLTASARALGFTFDRHNARNELQAATFRLRETKRVRLVLSPGGAIAIEVSPLPPVPPAPVRVAVVPLPVAPSDLRLCHKTSDRAFYDRARGDAGAFEVVFVAPDGGLTEGSFTSLFVRGKDKNGDDVLVTPPLAAGLLPGILRSELIDSGRAIEGRLTEADLTHDFFVGNALRGLMLAQAAVAGVE